MADIELKLEKECDYGEVRNVGPKRKTFPYQDTEYIRCNGGTLTDPQRTKCERCLGTGYAPTDFGRELLEFLYKYRGR